MSNRKHKALVCICIAALLLTSTPGLPAETAKGAGGSESPKTGSGNKTTGAETTLAASSTLCTVPAPAAAADDPSGDAGSTKPKAGSAKDKDKSAAGANGGAGTPPSNSASAKAVVVWSFPLPAGGTNAAAIAPMLSGAFPRVLKATAVNPSLIVALLDAMPVKSSAAPAQPAKPNAQPASHATAAPAQTAPQTNTAGRHAAATQTTRAAASSKPFDLTATKRQVQDYIDRLAQPDPDSFTITLSSGTGGACQVANALVRALPEIASITAIDDSRLLVSLVPGLTISPADLQKRVRGLARELATPPQGEANVQRLFYLHDPASVATLVTNAFPNVQAQPVLPDRVVLSDSADLDPDIRHTALKSARQTIATLDQPHPQVSVDTWSLQLATTNQDRLPTVIPELEDLTEKYNAAIDASILAGWSYLSAQIKEPSSLDPLLNEYLTYTTQVKQDGSTVLAAPTANTGSISDRYGLGFTTLYYPLTPNLVDMLVTLASLKNPGPAYTEMVNLMEGGSRDHNPTHPCRERDDFQYGITDKATRKAPKNIKPPSNIQLECVYDVLAGDLFAPPRYGTPATSALGQFRGALADFLFHYKRMLEYPDDFDPYLEPIAADNLDSALQPIVDAFEEDMSVFQAQLQAQIAARLRETSDIKYGYGGLVSLKVLGGQPGNVKTATQNYFDATPAPTLNDLFTNLQTEGASVQKSPLSSLVTSLAPEKTVELLTVLGQTLTPKATTAHLGRGLDMSVTAHTLSGAYGAELDLSVQSTENGAGLITAGSTKTTDDLNSRVSQHTVDTHVRVNTMKLLNVSTLSSVLARGQAPWKPIDPLFEIPGLGLLIKRPLPPKEVYTQSLVFASALVVPTSADLGFGVPMIDDQLLVGQNRYRKLKSLDQFDQFPESRHLGFRIEQYHQKIVDCLNREYLDGTGVHIAGNPDINQPCYNSAGYLSSADALQ